MKRILMGFMLMPFVALATLKDGLVAHYQFDGAVKDTSGNGYDLTVVGQTSYAEDRFGITNRAFHLENTHLHASDGNWNPRLTLTNYFTVACWFKTSYDTELKDESASGIYGADSRIRYLFNGCAGGLSVGNNGINVFECQPYWMPATVRYDADFKGGWHHLAVVGNGPNAGMKLYVDGVLVREGLVSNKDKHVPVIGSGNDTEGVGIGVAMYGTYFNGDVDEFCVYNRTLPAEEVKVLYTQTLYVNGTTGSDENYGTSPTAAKKTIQAAIDASVDGDTILVAPGTYAPIVATNMLVYVTSQCGAGATTIDANHQGRCVTFSVYGDSGSSSVLTGFTLINGKGMGWQNDGGGLQGGYAKNCIFTKCSGYAPAAASCGLINCLVFDNGGSDGVFGACFACRLENCTVASNSVYACWDSAASNSVICGSIYESAGASERYCYCLTDAPRTPGCGNITGDPKFVDAANGDYRLAAGSPCIDAGNNSYVTSETDLEGCGRIVNGTVDIGCYEFEPDGGPYVEKVGDIDWTYMIKNGRASVGDGVNVAATNLAGAVSIPSWLRQRPVAAIDEKALFNCKDVTSVAIPEGVKDVGSYAFGGCGGLKDIYLGSKTLTSLDADAFKNCNWDLIVHVPADWQGRGRTLCGYTVWKAGSSDEEKSVSMSITNTVVQYVLNSVQPEIAVPVSGDTGFVAVITEVTSSGAVSVPIEWRDNYPAFKTMYGNDFGKSLMMKSGKKDCAGNELFVWQDYVAGTDPTDLDDKFTASITMVGDVPVISYTPELTAEQTALREYKTFGKKQLKDEWTNLTDADGETMKNYNFFKVTVQIK